MKQEGWERGSDVHIAKIVGLQGGLGKEEHELEKFRVGRRRARYS